MSKVLEELAPVVEEHSTRMKELFERKRQERIQVQMDDVKCTFLLKGIEGVLLLIGYAVSNLFKNA